MHECANTKTQACEIQIIKKRNLVKLRRSKEHYQRRNGRVPGGLQGDVAFTQNKVQCTCPEEYASCNPPGRQTLPFLLFDMGNDMVTGLTFVDFCKALM